MSGLQLFAPLSEGKLQDRHHWKACFELMHVDKTASTRNAPSGRGIRPKNANSDFII
jgi:hypothetical protein